MSQGRGVLLSREDEIAAVEGLAGRPVLVVVRGEAGAGKTAFLGEMGHRWEMRGVQTVHVRFSLDGPAGDEFGLQAVVDAFRTGFSAFGDSPMAAALAAVCRLATPQACLSGRANQALFIELTRLFASLGQHGPAAVLFDDVPAAPNAALVVAAARHAGCTVLAAARTDATPTPLTALADQVLDLRSLPACEAEELLAAAAGAPLDAAVAPAVHAALGPLAGNPGAVLAVLDALQQAGRLTPVQGVLCLTGREPIGLPPEHPLLRLVAETAEPGPRLLALIASAGRFRVDDLLALAETAGWCLAASGQAIDRFVATGLLSCDPTGALMITCPALATAVLDLVGLRQVRELHRVFAEHLLRGEIASAHDRALVADQVALAGPELPPHPAALPLLCAEADWVWPVEPLAAARWYRAALAHARPHHPDRVPGLTGTLLRLLVRHGHYDRLGEVVAESVAAGVPAGLHYELAVCAALAALHTGVPVPPAVHEALAAEAAGRAPLAIAASWFGGQEAVRLAEFRAAFGPFRLGAPAEPGPTEDEIEIAGSRHDLLALFGFLLGEEYGAPEHGPVALYRRVITGYHAGEWAEVLSAARALEHTGAPSTPVHRLARLFAAEVLACQGECALAAGWLARAGGPGPFPALWSWVDTGLRWRTGRAPEAIELGWQGYALAAAAAEQGVLVGLHWLLIRLALLESDAGAQDRLLELSELARKWHGRYGGRRLQLAELMLTGLAEQDFASAYRAVEVLREHGNQCELMRACLILSLVAGEPEPWLHEAYEIARGLGDDLLRMNIKARMLAAGVTPPRRRGAAPRLSDVELRVIALIQQGLTNRQIAGAMRVSEKTVESYLTRLFAKTGCRSRLDLATASIEGRLAVSEPHSDTA